MLTAELAKKHFEYHAWASQALLEAAAQATQEQLAAATGVSFGSLLGTLQHIFFADRVWIARVNGQNRPLKAEGESPSLAELGSLWSPVQRSLIDWAAGLSPEVMNEEIHWVNIRGEHKKSFRWKIALHVVNHGTYHRGQIVSMLRQMDYPVPATDLIYYPGM
jgi:uncharacterized damage-inducible protein DinB